MNIRTKLLTVFLTITIAASAVIAVVIFINARNLLQKTITQDLEHVADLKKEKIETFFNVLRDDISVLKDANDVRRGFAIINEEATSTSAYTEAIGVLHDHLRVIQQGKGFEDVLLVNPNKQIVYVANEGHGSMDPKNPVQDALVETFESAKTGVYFSDIFEDFRGYRFAMLVAAPVRAADGAFLGELIIEVNMDPVYAFIQDIMGLGETGETLIAKKENGSVRILNPLRNDKGAALKRIIQIGDNTGTDVQQAAQEERGSGTAIDYRGNGVLAAWRSLPALRWVMVSKIDLAEAFAPIQTFGVILVIISGIVMGIFVIAAFILARSISEPIERLEKGADIVAKGDLDHKIGMKGNDEVGRLSRAFDAMTEKLKESYEGLEEKVHIRTAGIEEEKQKFITLIEHLPVGVFMMKAPEGIVVAANPKSLALLGQNKDLWEEKQKSYRDVHAVIRATREDGSPYPVEELPITIALRGGKITERNDIVITRPDGEKVTLRLIGVPVKGADGKVIYAIAVFDDITKEHEIDRAKTEFVSLASHQLRTPLSTINWYTEMLLAEDVGKITPDQKSYLEEIYKGNQRMVGLVNALLNVSRIETGTFATEVKAVDLEDELDLTLKEFEPMIREKKMNIAKDYAPDVPILNVDQKMIHIIFQNLISNAVKYTPPEGRIMVHVRREGAGHVYIEVSDTGYGIPKHQYDRIFTKLFRADNIVGKDTEGTGLGLYLVRLVVEQLKGKIWFVSEEKKGTSFFITIPIQ